MFAVGIAGLVLAVICLDVGRAYGHSEAQIAVATALAKEKVADASVEKFVNRVLLGLKAEYTLAYDEIEADLLYWKRGV